MAQQCALLVTPVAANDVRESYRDTFRFTAPDAAALPLTNNAVQRGDGIFETIGVFDQHPHQLEEHLQRLANSAQIMDLPEPNLAQWREAVIAASRELPMGETMLKLAISRPLASEADSAWILGSQVPDFSDARQNGISVVTLERGVASDAGPQAPWLLLGAKTLSYAMNMAALREAARRGADDVIFVSTDGYALEGPTSSLLLRFGDTFVTPAPQAGILHGTTQLSAFDFLKQTSRNAEYRLVRSEELFDADAAWLLSSVRQASPIRSIDGRAKAIDRELSAELNKHLLAPG